MENRKQALPQFPSALNHFNVIRIPILDHQCDPYPRRKWCWVEIPKLRSLAAVPPRPTGPVVVPVVVEPTEASKQSIRTRYLGHVTGYQPIRDQYFLIRSVPDILTQLSQDPPMLLFSEERELGLWDY
eukprot:sb/3475421/